jgi:UDP-N-acetylglucosamine 2-epimerase (non-hydrolysing)
VPEELNRKVIDHLSDINLTLTEHARRYLIAEGIRPETVFKVGSSMPEILAHHRAQIDTCEVLVRLGLERGRFLVVSAHREENVDDPACLAALMESVNAFPDYFDGRTVIFSVHPRTRKRLERDRLVVDPRVQLLKPLGFIDYIALQQAAFCVVSDSGTLTEEASLLGFPGVMIRNAHERPEGMDEGTVVMCGLQRERVHEAVTLVTRQVAEGRGCMRPVADYQAENVSAKIVRIIHSYVDYVNRTVWGK